MVDPSGKFTLDKTKIEAEFAKQTEWSRAILLDKDGKVLASKNATGITPDDAKLFIGCLTSRDNAIGFGFSLGSERYNVLRYHPPLVYGRHDIPDDSEGIAYCRAKSKVNGEQVHMVVCYVLPVISPRAIPQMQDFIRVFIGDAV